MLKATKTQQNNNYQHKKIKIKTTENLQRSGCKNLCKKSRLRKLEYLKIKQN